MGALIAIYLTMTVAYHLAILLLPLLLSRDVFSYAYYGRILSRYGGNPYVNTPADYAGLEALHGHKR